MSYITSVIADATEEFAFLYLYKKLKNYRSSAYFSFWGTLSSSSLITMAIIQRYQFPWNSETLSYNPNINAKCILQYNLRPMISNSCRIVSLTDIENNPELKCLSTTAIATVSYIRSNHLSINWTHISTIAPLQLIEETINYPWKYLYMSANPNIRLWFILQYPGDWFWSALSANPGITMNDIENNPMLPWVYKCLSIKTTAKFLLEHINEDWDWGHVSANPEISLSFINDNPTLPWVWSSVSANPNIKMSDVIRIKKSWNWFELSKNLSITEVDINNHKDKFMRHLDAIEESEDRNLLKLMTYVSERYMAVILTSNPIALSYILQI